LRGFLIKFVGLSIVSGSTIGISKILITVFGLSLQATNWQLGLIGAAETLGLALGTIPAGIMVSRGSPRALYGKASAIVAVCYLLIPRLGVWFALLPLMLFTGFCISYRIVSMSSIFLGQLGAMGNGWAGWYKGTLALGTMAIGPWMGHLLTKGLGIKSTFYVSAGLFAGMATIGLLALPPTDGNGARRSRRRTGNCLRPIWQNRQVRLACFMEGLSGYCSAFFSTFMLVILMRDHGWARDRAVHLFVLNGVVYVSVLLGAGWVLSKVDRGILDRVIYGATAVAMVGLGLADRPLFFGLWTAVFSLGLGFNNLINVTNISSSGCDRGHVSGAATLMQMSGGCLGAFVGGLLSWVLKVQLLFVLFSLPWLAALVVRPRYRLDSTVNEESIVVGSLKYAHQPPIGQHLIDMLGDEALVQSQEK
jgi:MFS family permease